MVTFSTLPCSTSDINREKVMSRSAATEDWRKLQRMLRIPAGIQKRTFFDRYRFLLTTVRGRNYYDGKRRSGLPVKKETEGVRIEIE